jgi:hypothetical protein
MRITVRATTQGDRTMTYTFRSPGYRAVEAGSAPEAAEIFARRQARRDYGKRGYVRTMRHDCQTENGMSHTFQAFIGYNVERTLCSGRNIWIYVDQAESV